MSESIDEDQESVIGRQIEQHRTISWLDLKSVAQLMIGIVVTSALLSAWLIAYLSPILTAKNELALLGAEIAEKKAEMQRMENEELAIVLAETRTSLDQRLADTLRLNDELQKQQEAIRERLEDQRYAYSKLKSDYEELAATTPDASVLSDEIARLQKSLEAVENQQAKSAEQKKEIEKIINASTLSGLWEDLGSRIDGKKVYLEFLADGKIRTHAGIGGESWVFANNQWRLSGGNLVIESEQQGTTLVHTGSLSGDSISGSQSLPSGGTMAWNLRRVR